MFNTENNETRGIQVIWSTGGASWLIFNRHQNNILLVKFHTSTYLVLMSGKKADQSVKR